MTHIAELPRTDRPFWVGGSHQQDAGTEKSQQLLARMTGFLFVVTFATSIPAFFISYAPIKDASFILGGDFSMTVAGGAVLEMVLIAANVGTALALYPVLKGTFPGLSLAFVAARIIESTFIAIGIVAVMALNSLRSVAFDADPQTMTAIGAALSAVHDWTFRLGPGVVVGVGNGLILGWMMWRTRLVPRALSTLGLFAGPALLAAGLAVMLGHVDAGGTAQAIATIPEFIWELSLGLWLLVRGFDQSALRLLSTI
jgi:Domain of unknown function (DUF4386)